MNCTIQTCDENCHAIIQYHVAMQLTCRGNMQDPNSPQCWLVNASSPNRVSCLAAVVR
jgi:hypothetical protein